MLDEKMHVLEVQSVSQVIKTFDVFDTLLVFKFPIDYSTLSRISREIKVLPLKLCL